MNVEILRRLAAGDVVVIEHPATGERHRATVGERTPRGDFSVDWYSGRNRYAPKLPGHWYAEFGPAGAPKHGWRIVEVDSSSEAAARRAALRLGQAKSCRRCP